MTAGCDQGEDIKTKKVRREMEDEEEKDKTRDRGRWKKPNHSVKSQHYVGDLNEYTLFPGSSSLSPRG